MKKQQIDNYFEFLKAAQKLKSTLRHSWTEDCHRQESVAEHSWHMSLLAIVFSSELVEKVNLTKVLKTISVHDLGEAITGDIPAFSADHNLKDDGEKEALKKIAASLPSLANKEIISLHEEYKKRETNEAVFTKMLDVIDVIFQHLVADISTWNQIEFTFNLQKDSICFFEKEPFMLQIYNEIHNKLEEKVKKYNSDSTRITKVREIIVGGKYKHYKGNLYEVVAVARDSEDPQKELVVYKALYDSPEFGNNQVWVRSKEDFLAEVTKNGKTIFRFEEM